jgi:hypothetical protein
MFLISYVLVYDFNQYKVKSQADCLVSARQWYRELLLE